MKKNNHIISYYVFYIFFFLVIKWSIIYNKYKKLIKIAYNNYYASAAPLLRCSSASPLRFSKVPKVPKSYTENT